MLSVRTKNILEKQKAKANGCEGRNWKNGEIEGIIMLIISMPIVLGFVAVAGAMIGGAFILVLDAELIRRRRKREKNRRQWSLDRQVREKSDSALR